MVICDFKFGYSFYFLIEPFKPIQLDLTFKFKVIFNGNPTELKKAIHEPVK